MSSPYDLKKEEEVKEYLDNLGTEYRFDCYHEKRPDGCHRLADYLECVKIDFEKAAKVFRMNCEEHKYGHSCFKYANYKVSGKGTTKNVQEGLDFHKKGCDYGYVLSCHNAGLLYSAKDLGNLMDMNKSVQYLTKACDQNLDKACYHLSGLYINGTKGIQKDMKKAFDLAFKACDMGSMYACANVSLMYKKGEGVTKDLTLSDKYKQKAKDLQQSAKESGTITFSE